jgi:hypothetical protein
LGSFFINRKADITSKSTRTKNSGLFAPLHFSPLFLACYLGVRCSR